MYPQPLVDYHNMLFSVCWDCKTFTLMIKISDKHMLYIYIYYAQLEFLQTQLDNCV